MIANEVLLIDLSSVAYPIWHTNQGDPNPNSTSQKIVARVRDLAREHARVAICKDSGRSFRKDLTETYKANRPESDATLQHQIKLACQLLEHDGFPIWGATGFEADDVLATATAAAIQQGLRVMVCSDDKDLLQLVDDVGGVRQFRPTKGVIFDAAKVKEEFGILPSQVVDYLTLVGDSADNVYGAKGIGPKTAATLLNTFDSLMGVYRELASHPTKFKPAAATSLKEFQPRLPLVQQLIELRFDAPIDFDQVLTERKPAKTVTNFNPNALDEEDGAGASTMETTETPAAETAGQIVPFQPAAQESNSLPAVLGQREMKVAELMPPTYEMGLDPRNLKEARVVALDMLNSGMFSAYGSAEGVLATIMLGRELGIPCMTALRQIHIIDGKQGLSAQLMVALVLKSGFAEYFEPVELTDTRCTWTTHRRGSKNPFSITHTIEMAEKAGLLRRDKDGNLKESGWAKNPQDMLTARASSRLARMIYPDVVGNLYTEDELRDIREQNTLAAKVAGVGA